MKTQNIERPEYYDKHFRFYNLETHQLQHDIWSELQQGMWRDFNIDAFLNNEKEYAKLVEQKEDIHNRLMFPNYGIVSPGYRWDEQRQDTVIEQTTIQLLDGCSRHTLIKTIEQYFKQFEGQKIGVHLSGGLDSSIIMAWLKELHIPFTAIGFKSNRWEFRTEKRVQEVMAEYADYAELIDVDEYPFYSHIEDSPKCQTPYAAAFKSLNISNAIVKRFKELDVNVVFSGQGGDSLFVDPVQKDVPLTFAIGDEFEVSTEEDLLYAPADIKLAAPYSDLSIIQQISSLRLGEKTDALKWWARRYFHDILPKELSEFCYVADMFGLSQSGLEMAKQTVKRLFEEAYDLTHNANFSPAQTEQFLKRNVFELEFETYIAYVSHISVAAWLHTLFRNN